MREIERENGKVLSKVLRGSERGNCQTFICGA